MTRHDIIQAIGADFMTANIEGGEYSYVKEAGTRAKLRDALGHDFTHYKVDIRFEKNNVVVLVETKQSFTESDSEQLKEYVEEERALHPEKKIVGILANTTSNDNICVWKQVIDSSHQLLNETRIDSIEHYSRLFEITFQNDRETVLKNTLALNELLHRIDIDEPKRSQFVGTTLLYIKKMVKQTGLSAVDEEMKRVLNQTWDMMDENSIRTAIKTTLDELLDGSENKHKKIELLQKNVLEDQKVKRLTKESWKEILNTILFDIYRYINADSSEGQDILNMFFIAFNKYTGRADKNQAFTPDHITDFMCRITDVDRTKVVLDATCGSGSFLVQAMVKELADCRRGRTESEAVSLMRTIKETHIFGIENEEKAYGLATTNMLIHGDGNSNIRFDSCFNCEEFIKNANPDVILMNPPYNAKPIGIPDRYKINWGDARDGKEDPTKGYVFIQFLSDIIAHMNLEREENGQPRKTVKLAVLLPVSAAIGSSTILAEAKSSMLINNRLEAVFTLPEEVFYPGAAVNACCMVFTLGLPHVNPDGTTNETFFGLYKDDGFKKKKNLGRIEQFDDEGHSKWRAIENDWIRLFRNKTVVDGLTATHVVDGDDEWLCEAFMNTDYSSISQGDFQKSINDNVSFLIKSANNKKTEEFLSTDQWFDFEFSKLFDIERGNITALKKIKVGTTPIVSASGENEGISFWGDVDAPYQNNITISMNGVNTGFTSYHGYAFNINVDCCVLKQKFELNKYVALFLTTVINQLKRKYSYGRKMTAERIVKETIKLPIQRDSEARPIIDPEKKFSNEGFIPDWQYMEDYIKTLQFIDRL